MFGAMGYKPLLKFYRSDEYTSGLEAAVIIPRDEEVSWRVQSMIGAGYQGFSGGKLNLTNTLTLRSGNNWMESLKGEWTIPVQKSLLGLFYGWIADAVEKQSSWLGISSLLNSEYEHLRINSLELTLDSAQKIPLSRLTESEVFIRWRLSVGHEVLIRILGRLNFSAFARLNLSEDTQNEMFVLDALLGTSLRISF
jgi:hypothetical protein